MSSIKCPHCGLPNFATAEICKRCEKPINAAQSQIDNVVTPPDLLPAVPIKETAMTKSQGYILIALISIGLVLLTWTTFKQQPKYEYKVVEFMTESNDRTGEGALRFTSIKVDEQQIASMGAEGWELVGTFLEMETAYPNFGRSEYVTGLQPNIRPQRAVLIFKRHIK